MQDESSTGKFIVFKISHYLLALPMTDVVKVISYSAIENKGLKSMGVVQVGRHMIKVLDWHQQLSYGDSVYLPEQPFLVITRQPQGELCGILVDEPPDLMELPQELLQSLTPSSHQYGVFEMVSHVAILSENGTTTTIFLLDMHRNLEPAINEPSPRLLRPS